MVKRKRLFDDTLQDIVDRLRPERALVMYEGDSEQLAVWAAHGVEKDEVWTSAPLSHTVFKRVYTSGEPILTADAQHDPGLEDSSSLLLTGIRSMLCVPIRQQEVVVGLLYADQRMSQTSFTETDLIALTNLSRDLERRLRSEQVPTPTVRVEVQPKKSLPSVRPGKLKLDARSRVLWLRCLATMLNAGVSLARCLSLLADQGENQAMRSVARRVRSEVESGRPLSEAMRVCGPAFSEFQLQLIKMGEQTGALLDVLGQVADHDERDRALRMRLRASLTYPAALFVACTLMLLLLPPLFLKGQSRMLELSGVDPPLLTRIVVGTAGFVGSPVGMLALLGSLTFLVLSWRSLWRSRSGRRVLTRELLKLPALGRVLLLVGTSRFARSLALQVQVGLNLLQAVPSAAAASDDAVLVEQIQSAVAQLRDGADLSRALESVDYFPRGFPVLVRAGEESGHLEETLQWVARLYELELECSLEMLCAMLEPVMMGLMGVAAGLICLATMLPLVKLVQTL